MKKKKVRVCPICNNKYSDEPAISRTDNKTLICSSCGQSQSLQDFFQHQNSKLK